IAALLLAWLCANGAVWNLAQAVAWTRMFADYTQTLTVGEALRETFDPQKPCPLCVAVQQARAADHEQNPASAPLPAAGKLDLVCDSTPRPLFAAPAIDWPEPPAVSALVRHDPVPLRPPRV